METDAVEDNQGNRGGPVDSIKTLKQLLDGGQGQ